MNYERDPKQIYRLSFERVRAEADLGGFPSDVEELAVRLIHACGMPEIAKDVAYSPDCVSAGQQALRSGAPIFCDSMMVAHGVIRKGLAQNADVRSTIKADGVVKLAEKLGTTRSAAAVEFWKEELGGAVVAIGNAPTALFHLLERLDEGWPRPAVILGFPVGFVGAAESKAELCANPRGVPFITLQGRRGGSAMAAAAVNALSLGLDGDGR
ncbi:MAG: precorrin-8X methylmutase [Cohaesibacteraceae bacterium]